MNNPRYLSARSQDNGSELRPVTTIVGVPYDGAVSYRAGAAAAPDRVRLASDSIESYCPRLDRDLEDAALVDLGDLDVSPEDNEPTPGEAFVRHIRRQLDALPSGPLLAIGGDHLIAYPFLTRALENHPDLAILHIDAHADLRDAWDGDPFNHATVMGRVLDTMGPDANIYPWGIRSGLREEFKRMDADPRIHRLPDQAAALELVKDLIAAGRPIYITFDVDGLDPSAVPGTGTPEPGGLSYREVEDVLISMLGANLVGADLVELAPPLDPSGVTDVVGARLARTLLLLLQSAIAPQSGNP